MYWLIRERLVQLLIINNKCRELSIRKLIYRLWI